jgi:hypothetical protein
MNATNKKSINKRSLFPKLKVKDVEINAETSFSMHGIVATDMKLSGVHIQNAISKRMFSFTKCLPPSNLAPSPVTDRTDHPILDTFNSPLSLTLNQFLPGSKRDSSFDNSHA